MKKYFLLIFCLLPALSLSRPLTGYGASPITRRINLTDSLANVDRSRAFHLRQRILSHSHTDAKRSAAGSIVATNQAVMYTVNVGFGSSTPTTLEMVVDISNGVTTLGKKPLSSTAYNCVSGPVTAGTKFQDTITLSTQLVVHSQAFVVSSSLFEGVDGVLGLGRALAGEICNVAVPTVTDNLFSQKVIPFDLVSLSFNPTSSLSTSNGELTFGGTDSTKYTGNISYTPITTTSPANEYWGVDAMIRYGVNASLLASGAGILDTGTTLILIPTDTFQDYLTHTGGVMDAATGLVKITSSQLSNLRSLFFTIGSTTHELTANAQLWPRSLNTAIGGTANSIYLVIGDIGTLSGSGLDFILGYTFLERFYSVYSTTNSSVGLATTSFTNAVTN